MTKLSPEELTSLNLLLSIDGIGPGKIKSLLQKFTSTEKILSASELELISTEGIYKLLAQRIKKIIRNRSKIEEETKRELDRINDLKINITSLWDSDYPELLKNIYDPPLLLYYKGALSELDKFSIAIVGTRKPTEYGKLQTQKITSDLASQNITIVSGLARGIDSIAHSAALKSNGRTIAVIGSGLNKIYPPENKNLFEEIYENGVIFSEYKLDTNPDAGNFPQRNRIISGLSLGCIVVESGIPGGALQTAQFALDQNREVFAIPGNLGVKQSEGTNALIQKGTAKLVKNAEDVLVELELKLKPVVGKNIPKPKPDLNLFEEKLLNILIEGQIQIDKIASLSNLSTSDCLVHLLSLEFKGLVKQLPGKVFSVI
ncbi:MAG: DNA-processing protein DprA [Ignavibacteriaceae bacterium]